MSKSLQGYTTIDKSLSGIITISDGGGTTISEGNITCKSINVTGGGGGFTADSFNATNLDPYDNDDYRIVLTTEKDPDSTPYPFYTDFQITYNPNLNLIYAIAEQIWSINETEVPAPATKFPLYFGNEIGISGANYPYLATYATYQPYGQVLEVKNFKFINNINTTSALDFSNNMTRTPLIYDGLGGNGLSGLPVYNSTYDEVRFPTNLRTSQEFICDGPAYFNSNGNTVYKNMLVTDGDFLERTYMNIVLTGNGTTYSVNNVSGIDFTTYQGRFKSACRIYGRDNNAYSTDLIFETATSGNGGNNNPTERLRITANGNIGINKNNPQYLLDVGGSANFDNVYLNNLYVPDPYGTLSIGYNVTGGNIWLGNTPFFNGTLTIGNSSNLYNTIGMYASDGQLYGNNWKATTAVTGTNTTRIATCAFVKNSIDDSASRFLQLNYSGGQFVNSSVGFNGYLSDLTPLSYSVVGSGTNQYDNVICSYDGLKVYTFATGGKTLYGSNDGGQTWASLYTSANVLNNVACSGSGRYVFIAIQGLVSQYSANGGNTFQAMTIAAITTYYTTTHISCSYDNTNTLIVAFTNSDTALGRISIYVNLTAPSGSWISGSYITGSASQTTMSHTWVNIPSNPTLLISTGLGQTVFACNSPYNVPLVTPGNVVFSGSTITGKIKSNYAGNFAMLPTAGNLYQSQNYGYTNWTVSVASASLSSHCSKGGNIFIYSGGNNLYISNNQYASLTGSGSALPTYTLLYTASGTIKDSYISASGNKIFFTVTGQLDKIYIIDIEGPMSVYNTDFFVSKDRQTVRASLPSEPLNTFLDVLQRDKIGYISASTTLTLPFFNYYALCGSTNFTITLPAITDHMLGIKFDLFHVNSKTVTINCNANDAIVPPAVTLVITATTYSYTTSATQNRISLMPILCQSIQKAYLWMIL